jgi:Zn-dependent protease with chaperone function
MTVAVYLPLVLAVALAAGARWVGARGTPGPAARALAAASAVAAFASTWSLTLLALTLFDDVPPLSALDNHPTLDLPEPVPGPVALVAALLLVWGLWRLSADVKRRHGTLRQLRRAGRAHGGLVIAEWAEPVAIAVPGRPGHVLVTTGILKVLHAAERRVLFAHERAHLAHHHHRLVAVTAAAAALNPLLGPARDAACSGFARWASPLRQDDAAAFSPPFCWVPDAW